jgi:hypothetical protein
MGMYAGMYVCCVNVCAGMYGHGLGVHLQCICVHVHVRMNVGRYVCTLCVSMCLYVWIRPRCAPAVYVNACMHVRMYACMHVHCV